MSRELSQVRIGSIVTAAVVEIVGPDEVIVSIDGQLLRVVDKTLKLVRSTKKIDLVVVRVKPLAFKFAHAQKSGRISITV